MADPKTLRVYGNQLFWGGVELLRTPPADGGEPAHDESVICTRFSSSGRWMLSLGEDALLLLWDLQGALDCCRVVDVIAHPPACETLVMDVRDDGVVFVAFPGEISGVNIHKPPHYSANSSVSAPCLVAQFRFTHDGSVIVRDERGSETLLLQK